ncbi:MAG: aspartate aminotransferase family protein [Desulfobacterales bacterium]|jgi:adenosylmethionine-8-amino-7-oxononanoate aminotransferase
MNGTSFPLWQPFTPPRSFLSNPLVIEKGQGVHIYDTDGNKYIDASGGLWNISCGLGHKGILEAMHAQLDDLAFSPLFNRANKKAIELAQKLVAITPGNLTRVFLTNSGSEAIEVTIKAIRGHFNILGKKRHTIVALRHSYHGSYYGSGTLSDNISRKYEYQPNLPGVLHIEAPYCYRCTFNLTYPSCKVRCADELADVCIHKGHSVAAFIMEPILGSGGIIVPPPGYFDRVKEICEQEGIFWVLDEVATGFGRIGEMFASDLFRLEPDVMTMSKGINSGYLPLGAAVFSEDIFAPYLDEDAPLQFGSSQNGNPICCASALATINVLIEENLIDNCRDMGRLLKQGCVEIMAESDHVGDVRGEGLMLGVELVQNQSDHLRLAPGLISFVSEYLQDNGLIVYPSVCGFSMFPPLNITASEVDAILSVLKKTLPLLRFEDQPENSCLSNN